jgi:hypothetical protein
MIRAWYRFRSENACPSETWGLLIRRDLTKVPRVRAVADYFIEVFQRERRLLTG